VYEFQQWLKEARQQGDRLAPTPPTPSGKSAILRPHMVSADESGSTPDPSRMTSGRKTSLLQLPFQVTSLPSAVGRSMGSISWRLAWWQTIYVGKCPSQSPLSVYPG